MRFQIGTSGSIGILYLGRRGAGRLFTENMMKSFIESAQLEIAILSSSAKYSCLNHHVIRVRTPHNYKKIYMIFFYFADISKIVFRLRHKLPPTFIIPMASPFDYFLTWLLRRQGVKIIRIIHDVNPHLGERWPKNKSIQRRILNSDGVIFLSDHVLSECKEQFNQQILYLPPACVIEHPYFPQDLLEKVNLPDGFENYSLIIGRVEEYKGIPEFLSLWKTRSALVGGKLLIAGDGRYSGLLQDLIAANHEDVFFLNKWLSDSEFEFLIANAQLVILPYLEATQSGVIPIARNYKVPMLVSSKGGLLQQLSDYPKYEIYDHTIDLSQQLQSLLGTNSRDRQPDNTDFFMASEFISKIHKFIDSLDA